MTADEIVDRLWKLIKPNPQVTMTEDERTVVESTSFIRSQADRIEKLEATMELLLGAFLVDVTTSSKRRKKARELLDNKETT